jgi:UDPglucose 6-dehydrogenase/UDP-N-acetyl-D-galactosamine dehydrogenase
MIKNPIICVVGMGYVGYPEAVAFAKHFSVNGYDIDADKVCKLNISNKEKRLVITQYPDFCIPKADFIIIAVPTPINEDKTPDLSPVESVSKTVGKYMKKGCTVILESTVYPGVSEEIMLPILEKESGYKVGKDFKIAFSPERINPGDDLHSIDKVTKVVGGMDKETTDLVAELYDHITLNTFKATSIKVAEASKVIENVQRDLNIALMNELSFIFKRMNISIRDVIEASATKWNFYKIFPGMIGGHCIPVDPYYLTYKSEQLGFNPKLIYTARMINNGMPYYVAKLAKENIKKQANILIAGLTYKENVPDIRESPSKHLIEALKEYNLFTFDPLLEKIEKSFDIKSVRRLSELKDIDCIIFAVVHDVFKEIGLEEFKAITRDNPLLIDVRCGFNREEAEKLGFKYITL